jgi:hypothetical protein
MLYIDNVSYSGVPDMHRYEARKGDSLACPKGKIKVTDDVSDYPWMFGIFVPITTGHLPIDVRQKIKYNCCKRLRRESLIKPHSMWSRAT